MDAKAIKALLVELKPDLLRKYPIASIGLFGSVVRDDFGPESDIDIIVDFHRPVGMEFSNLAYELEKNFHRTVDLVSVRGIKKKYLEAIQREIVYV